MFLILLFFCFVNYSLSNRTLESRRIYDGFKVLIEQYPYSVFLHFLATRPSSCGASLITAQAVITAAHCVDEIRYNDGYITAYFGASMPGTAKVVRSIIDHKIHPKYRESKGKSDMAVLFLESRVPLIREIKKIPLAAADPGYHVRTTVVAWGRQDGSIPHVSLWRNLKGSAQTIITPNECARYTTITISPKVICTKPLKGLFAKDDGGSGLVVIEHSIILVGILSFVMDGEVAFYTNVFAERDWIIKTCYNLFRRNCPYKEINRRKVPFV